MKIAPVARALASRERFDHVLVHTGQHYDDVMSKIFFEELSLPSPDVYLGVGAGTRAAQTARVLAGLEPVLDDVQPDVVLVPGDVTSTFAAALAAANAGVPVGHIEAGLRSFDRTMPEELNRVLTDQLSDLLFIHSPEAREHLIAEGKQSGAIHDVGNTMIDTLVALRDVIAARRSWESFGVNPGGYVLVTLHRPALVDGDLLEATLESLAWLASELPVLFPVHPRTRARIGSCGLAGTGSTGTLRLVDPLGYLDFMSLLSAAAGVLTDSGGVQEETTFLGIPCFTLRANTERPITVSGGSNVLLGLDPLRIREIPQLLAERSGERSQVPPNWDGLAAERIADVLMGALE